MGTTTERKRRPAALRCEHCDAPACVQVTFARRTINLCGAHWEDYGAGASFLALEVRETSDGHDLR